MVIGDDLSYTDLLATFQQAAAVLGRHVNPTLLSRDDWRGKPAQKDSFVVSKQPKIFLYGSEEHLQG